VGCEEIGIVGMTANSNTVKKHLAPRKLPLNAQLCSDMHSHRNRLLPSLAWFGDTHPMA
jgi:hypothetical protein